MLNAQSPLLQYETVFTSSSPPDLHGGDQSSPGNYKSNKPKCAVRLRHVTTHGAAKNLKPVSVFLSDETINIPYAQRPDDSKSPGRLLIALKVRLIPLNIFYNGRSTHHLIRTNGGEFEAIGDTTLQSVDCLGQAFLGRFGNQSQIANDINSQFVSRSP